MAILKLLFKRTFSCLNIGYYCVNSKTKETFKRSLSNIKLFNKICKYIIKSNSTIDTNYKIIEADKNNISYIRKINNTHLSLQIDEFTLTWLLFCESSNRRCYVVLKNSKIVCHFFVRNLEVGYGGEKILLMEKIELYSLDKEILKVIISFTKNIMFNENFSAIFIVENRDEYTTLLDGLLLIRKKIRFPYYYKFLDDQKECPIIGSFLDPDRGEIHQIPMDEDKKHLLCFYNSNI